MNIIITTRKQHHVSDEILFDLIRSSYQQWIDAGIKTSWLHYTFQDFKKNISRSVIYLALDENSNEVLGMHCFRLNLKRMIAHGFYLAVLPKVKHQGIATRMLQEEVAQIRQRGFRYLTGYTEVSAPWSVRWHLKNGYRIIGYHHAPAPYSDTYTFRLQLVPSLLWGPTLGPITAKLRYFASKIKGHMYRMGTPNL